VTAIRQRNKAGLTRRQCTSEYKIRPLKKAARQLLGYPHPRRVPRGVYAEQAIGISIDEFTRAKDSDVAYLRNVFPLIELGWDRAACAEYLAKRGFGRTVKSACVGCPFHGNAGWRLPAPLLPATRPSRPRPPLTGRHLRLVGHDPAEEPDPDGYSPWSCRSGDSLNDQRATRLIIRPGR
jgi:hypothetical protein